MFSVYMKACPGTDFVFVKCLLIARLNVLDHLCFFFPQQFALQVTGDTVYNMLRLAEVECDHEERPLNAHKIKSTEVFSSSSSSFICLFENFLILSLM